jgi:hypothetical protein
MKVLPPSSGLKSKPSEQAEAANMEAVPSSETSVTVYQSTLFNLFHHEKRDFP